MLAFSEIGGATVIIKTHKSKNFTAIHNAVVDDSNMTPLEFRILIRLLSKPESWDVSIRAIANDSKKHELDEYKKMLEGKEEGGAA